MLTLATLGMVGYGLYEIGYAIADLFYAGRLEIVANLGSIAFGSLLVLAAAFVRVMVPGGIALAIGALFGLQALALHQSAHLYGMVALAPQLLRALFGATVILIAHMASRQQSEPPPGF